MSFTTMDIGASIKEAIREVGRQNAESSANIKETALGIKNAVSDVGRQNAESSANIMESIREVGRQNVESDAGARKAMLDSLAQSNRGFDGTLKEIAKSQSVMVALLKNMNEPREAPGGCLMAARHDACFTRAVSKRPGAGITKGKSARKDARF